MLSTDPFETPLHLLDRARAKGAQPTAVAGAGSELVLNSVRKAHEAELVRPHLVGERDAIHAAAEKIGWDVGGFPVTDSGDEAETAALAVGLARAGEARLLMKGSVHTDALMRAAVDRETGLRTDRRMSHVFGMAFPGHRRILFITDAALNVAPGVDARLAILRNAVGLLHGCGIHDPKAAVLSAVEVPSKAMPSSLEAAEIVARARDGEVEDAVIDGPVSLDLAVSAEAAAAKGFESPVAGAADLILVPNIETGNALFKSLVYFRSAVAAGVVLGATVPIVLTSRADPPEARLAAVALATMV